MRHAAAFQITITHEYPANNNGYGLKSIIGDLPSSVAGQGLYTRLGECTLFQQWLYTAIGAGNLGKFQGIAGLPWRLNQTI